jgi:hypothetical protein
MSSLGTNIEDITSVVAPKSGLVSSKLLKCFVVLEIWARNLICLNMELGLNHQNVNEKNGCKNVSCRCFVEMPYIWIWAETRMLLNWWLTS